MVYKDKLKIIKERIEEYKLSDMNIIDYDNIEFIVKPSITDIYTNEAYTITYKDKRRVDVSVFLYKDIPYKVMSGGSYEFYPTKDKDEIARIGELEAGYITIINYNKEGEFDHGYGDATTYTLSINCIGYNKFLSLTYYRNGEDVTEEFEIIKNRKRILDQTYS